MQNNFGNVDLEHGEFKHTVELTVKCSQIYCINKGEVRGTDTSRWGAQKGHLWPAISNLNKYCSSLSLQLPLHSNMEIIHVMLAKEYVDESGFFLGSYRKFFPPTLM